MKDFIKSLALLKIGLSKVDPDKLGLPVASNRLEHFSDLELSVLKEGLYDFIHETENPERLEIAKLLFTEMSVYLE